MRVIVGTLITLGIVAVAVGAQTKPPGPPARAAQGTRSQWSGIYTEAQAKRGEPVYA